MSLPSGSWVGVVRSRHVPVGPVLLTPELAGWGGRGLSSAVLGALRAGGRVAGGGDALDRSDLAGGHRGRGGRGLGQLRGGGVTLLAGEQLALPVGQRLVATDRGLL